MHRREASFEGGLAAGGSRAAATAAAGGTPRNSCGTHSPLLSVAHPHAMSLKRHPNPIPESPTSTETTSALHYQPISSARLGGGGGGGGGGGCGGGCGGCGGAQMPFGGTPRKNSRIDEFHCSKIEPVQEESGAASPVHPPAGYTSSLHCPSSAFAADRRHTVSGAGASDLRPSHRRLAQHNSAHGAAASGDAQSHGGPPTTSPMANPLVMVTEWASTDSASAAALQATSGELAASASASQSQGLGAAATTANANGMLSPSFSASVASDESGSELGELPSRPRLSSMCSRNRAHAVPAKNRRSSDTTQTQPEPVASTATNPMFLLPAYPAHTYAVTAQLATVQQSPVHDSPSSSSSPPQLRHYQHQHQHQHAHQHVDCGAPASPAAAVERPRAQTIMVGAMMHDMSREMKREYDRLQMTIDRAVHPGAHGHGVLEQQDVEIHEQLRRKASAGSNMAARNGFALPQHPMPGIEVSSPPNSAPPDGLMPAGANLFAQPFAHSFAQPFSPPVRGDRGDSGISPDMVSPAFPNASGGGNSFSFVQNYMQLAAAGVDMRGFASGARCATADTLQRSSECEMALQPPASAMPNSDSGIQLNALGDADYGLAVAAVMNNKLAQQAHLNGALLPNKAHVCCTAASPVYPHHQVIDICVTDVDAGRTTGPIPISTTS